MSVQMDGRGYLEGSCGDLEGVRMGVLKTADYNGSLHAEARRRRKSPVSAYTQTLREVFATQNSVTLRKLLYIQRSLLLRSADTLRIR